MEKSTEKIEVSIEEISNLRKLTGSGIMNCKKALLESNGDFDKAVEYLRKNGIKVANKRGNCSTNEGRVFGIINKDCNFGAIVSIFCETDFVANSEKLKGFINDVANIAIAGKIETLEKLNNAKYDDKISVKDKLIELIGVFGEKLDFQYTYLSGEKIGLYNHFNNKLSVLLEVKNYKSQDMKILKNISMQIAAMNPIAVKREEINSNIIEREMEIAREQSKGAKNADISEKMAKGKLEKFCKENVLLEQPFILNEKVSVLNYITQNGNFDVLKFKRVEISK